MTSEQFTQKKEFVDIPDGDKVKRKVKEKYPFHKSLQYNALRNHDSRDMGDLPFVLEGMSVVGDMKDMEVKLVIAKEHDGTEVEMMDPIDSIMNGSASAEDTFKFLSHYLRVRITPPGGSVTGREKVKHKDINSLLWYKNLPEFNKVISETEERIAKLKKHYEEEARNEAKNKGNIEIYNDFNAGTGELWQKFIDLKDKMFLEGVVRIKKLAQVLADEMNNAREFYNSNSEEDVVRKYGGFVSDGKYFQNRT
jgi:hypothetical protein